MRRAGSSRSTAPRQRCSDARQPSSSGSRTARSSSCRAWVASPRLLQVKSDLPDGRAAIVLRETENSAADKTVPESERELRFVVDAVPSLLAFVDNDARYVWANEAYRRWFGQSPETIRGRHVRDVLGPAAWEQTRERIARVLAGEEVLFENRAIYSHGPARDIQGVYLPHRDASGRVRGFVVMINDVTEMRVRRDGVAVQRAYARRIADRGARRELGGDLRRGLVRGPERAALVGRDVPDVRLGAWSHRGHPPAVHRCHPPRRSRSHGSGDGGGDRARRALREGISDCSRRRDRAPDPRLDQRREGPRRSDRPACSAPARTSPSNRRAEREIRQAREQLQLAVDSTPALIARYDGRPASVGQQELRRPLRHDTRAHSQGGRCSMSSVTRPIPSSQGTTDRVLAGETIEIETEVPRSSGGRRTSSSWPRPTLARERDRPTAASS